VFRCSACIQQESVTAGTILHRSKLPLQMWLWAAYLLMQDKRGISAMQLSRELNQRYATAWTVPHRLRRALFEKQDRLLSGVVEVDQTYYGGKGGSGGAGGGGKSMQSENKCLVIMSLERKPSRDKKAKGIYHNCFVAGNAKMAMAGSASAKDLGSLLKASLTPGTNPLREGWAAYIKPGNRSTRSAASWITTTTTGRTRRWTTSRPPMSTTAGPVRHQQPGVWGKEQTMRQRRHLNPGLTAGREPLVRPAELREAVH
jgi:hypothetical protein